jgi:hypothetical protein
LSLETRRCLKEELGREEEVNPARERLEDAACIGRHWRIERKLREREGKKK